MATRMRILPVDAASADSPWLAAATAILAAGGIVGFPTDTFYGLAVDPRRDDAVARLFDVKGRQAGVAVPLIAGSPEQAYDVGDFSAADLRLAATFWPGPLSIVVAAAPRLSRHLLGGGTTVAVRVPAHHVARQLALGFGMAITATSANLSGSPAAITADDVALSLRDDVDAVIDGGPAPGGAASTIVEVTGDGPRLIRAGPIAWERVLESLQ